MEMLDLNEFPGIPPLVQDTLAGTARIDFGFRTYPDPAAWIEQSKAESEQNRPIAGIVEAIRAQYGPLPIPDIVSQNLVSLSQPGTMTVVTGQQVGLGGGPLLTLYKAMTTVALARRLETGTGVRTVPIFWMATSDHNLVETAQSHWLDINNNLTSYYSTIQGNRTPVGSLPLGAIADEFVNRITKDIPESEFSKHYLDLLCEAYTPDKTFAQAFRQLGNELLGPYGLIFLDPDDVQLKRLSAPFMKDAVAEVDDRLERIIERSKMIQASGYKTQVSVKSGRTSLFLLEDGQRRKIVLEEKAIQGHTDIKLSRSELARIAAETPENLSAGVTLRPILQSWMLPVGAYIAGPHEMAYWSQLKDAFSPLGIAKPAVVHRASFTLIEPKVRRWLDKYDLKPNDMFMGYDKLSEQVIADIGDDESEHIFTTMQNDLNSHERVLTDLTRGYDFSGIERSVDASFRKINFHVDKLRNTFSQRAKSRHSVLLKHVEQLSNHIFPGGTAQERVISPIYYLARYGNSLLDGLSENALSAVGRHSIVDLKEWQ
ncbi:hypothetical protein BMS3Bbin04_00451 [bacterium BMS3Bbin04]|nr:hypothetical protein BMS3Bbin04_00451 [bacterium BMS3Bbin04]